MKVLYVGVYKDGTGWSHAAIDYILALDSVGVDVVPRAIKLNNIQSEIPERILELEKKSVNGCDYVIQNVLPYHMDYNGKLKKNIGLYFSETVKFYSSIWPDKLNTMDEVWVTDENMKYGAEISGVETEISQVPVPINTEKFYQNIGDCEFIPNDGVFRFYFIGEMNKRKNLMALLRAFHTEFDVDEPVSLLIKTNSPANEVQEYCNQIKQGLKLYPSIQHYKDEEIIGGHLTEKQMLELHKSCDCFVMPSRGEGWCIPAIEALAMGNTPIVNSGTSMSKFINNGNGWVVDSYPTHVFGMVDTFSDLYVGSDIWFEIMLVELMKTMRYVYANPEIREEKSNRGLESVEKFSYNNIGQCMKNLLEEKVEN